MIRTTNKLNLKGKINMMNVKVYVNGVERTDIQFTTATIQNLRVYGGENEVKDTKYRYWSIDYYDVTNDGIVLYLNE